MSIQERIAALLEQTGSSSPANPAACFRPAQRVSFADAEEDTPTVVAEAAEAESLPAYLSDSSSTPSSPSSWRSSQTPPHEWSGPSPHRALLPRSSWNEGDVHRDNDELRNKVFTLQCEVKHLRDQARLSPTTELRRSKSDLQFRAEREQLARLRDAKVAAQDRAAQAERRAERAEAELSARHVTQAAQPVQPQAQLMAQQQQQQAQHEAQRRALAQQYEAQQQVLQLQVQQQAEALAWAQAHAAAQQQRMVAAEHATSLAERTNATLKNQLAEAQAETERAQRESRKARTAEKKAEKKAKEEARQATQPPSVAASHDEHMPHVQRGIINLARPRYAFLVGIGSAYGREGGDLHNTTNDVKDLGEKLASVGFNCISLIDREATRANVIANLANLLRHVAAMDETIVKNGRSDLSVLVFYFSGHGRTSSKRRQQLCLPGKENLDLLDDVFKPIDARKATADREPANVVLLDCCRASAEQLCTDPEHTSIVYSCRVQQLSSDGQRGRNGVFTEQLLARLTTGVGVHWGTIISETRKGVRRATSGRQDPTYKSTSSLVDALVLVPSRAANSQHERLIEELTKVDSRDHWSKFTASLGSSVQSAKAWLSSFLPTQRETFLPATSENAVGHRTNNTFGIQLSKLYENTARFMRARPSAQDVEMEGMLRV